MTPFFSRVLLLQTVFVVLDILFGLKREFSIILLLYGFVAAHSCLIAYCWLRISEESE